MYFTQMRLSLLANRYAPTCLRGELARETRNRELAERDAMNYAAQVKDLREENGRLREDLVCVRIDGEAAMPG